MSDQAGCAHMRVDWTTTDTEDDGGIYGWWECRECGAMFAPVAALAPAELTRLRAEVETLKHNHEIECGALADEVHALKAELAAKTAELERVGTISNRQVEYSIKLKRLIENLKYATEPSYPELYHHKIIVETKAALSAATARAEKAEGELQSVAETPRGPDVCPITGRLFFMNLEHPELGTIATYGGPFDSYTVPSWDKEDEGAMRCERYDHDWGGWIEGGEPLPFHVITSDQYVESWEKSTAAESQLREARGEIERLRGLVK